MKLQNIFLTLLILFVSFQNSFGQVKNSDNILFDSVVEPDCEYLLNRLDATAAEIYNVRDSVGYVVIHGGSNSIENVFYNRAIRSYMAFRGIDPSRYKVITAKPAQKLKIEFWISKNKNKPPVSEATFTYNLPENSGKILFAEDSVEVVKIDGKLTYLTGTCEVCCIVTINSGLLSEFLSANPNLNAQITIFNKSTKRADQLARIILNQIIKNRNIERNRIKTVYGGIDQGISQLPSNISTVKIWLAPQKKK